MDEDQPTTSSLLSTPLNFLTKIYELTIGQAQGETIEVSKEKLCLTVQLNDETAHLFFQLPGGISLDANVTTDGLTKYSIFKQDDPHRELVLNKLFSPEGFEDPTFDKALGILLGGVLLFCWLTSQAT